MKNPTDINVHENFLDRIIAAVDPIRALRRMEARYARAVAGAYIGASKTRRQLSQWNPRTGDADSDTLHDLPTLRERSRDMVRNNPLASGALSTKITNVVGTGLQLQSRLDAAFLGLSEDRADRIQTNIEREWSLFWDSHECDVSRTCNGDTLTSLAYRQQKENGDVFVLLPRFMRADSTSPYALKVQLIEADRVCNRDKVRETSEYAGGVLKDSYGAPISYDILRQHPGSLGGRISQEWDTIRAFAPNTGLRQVLHLYQVLRPGQSRGVPDLAPVIEPLKQLDRYTEAELQAAVITAALTVFIKSATGQGLAPTAAVGSNTNAADTGLKLGSGAIFQLPYGTDITPVNPLRPNQAFDGFVMAILRQTGVALQLPFEILIKHFTSSYSAARAALLEAWKYFLTEREWLAGSFNQSIFENWMYEAVAVGRVKAPGFFSDPAITRAYCKADWIGPAKGMIDELKEVEAAKERISLTLTTHAEETSQLTGGDWESKVRQLGKERKLKESAGLLPEQIEAAKGDKKYASDKDQED